MFPVSAAYKTAIGKPIKERRIKGKIGNINFTDANIVTGTLKIDNQCSGGTELELGSVYIGEMVCVFRGINLTGAWMGKTITITEELRTGEETWEAVPLGKFHVVEAQHQETGVYVQAYDVMDYLDKTWLGIQTTGKPYYYFRLIEDRTGVQFAQTEQEIQALPNGNTAFALYAENDIQTYRDVLFWLAQLMCCFATATRDGKIVLRSYGMEAVDEIDGSARWQGSSFSDYETRYTGISLTKTDDQSTVYVHTEQDDGLTYNLGANPFLQSGVPDNAMNAILTALATVAYTPFSVDRCGCPAYDLGDVLTFPDGIGGDRTGCMMSYEYDYHDVYMIDGYGANPALYGAQSKTDKEIAGLMSRGNAQEFQFYNFTNLQEITLHDDYKEIIFIRFGSLKQTMVTFQAEIKLTATDLEEAGKIIGNVKYVFNGIEMNYKPVETWIDGVHLLHLLYYFQIDSSRINTLSVRMKTDQEIVIAAQDIYACVSGQGLVASDTWDGYIDVEEQIGEILPFATEPPAVAAFTDTPAIALQNIIEINATEQMAPIGLANEPQVVGFDDGAYINKYPLHALTWGTVQGYEWTEEGIYNMDETNPKYYAW